MSRALAASHERAYARPLVAQTSVQPVGRSAELARLAEALDAVDRGEAVRLVVEGEPGIGKSCLLAELQEQALGRGHLVLRGAGSEFERDLPFGVFADALGGVATAGEFGDGSSAVPGADERHRAHTALRRLLSSLAEAQPLVLVLDDVQWADPASAELVAALVRRDVAAPVCLALGYRTGLAPAALETALRDPGVRLLELEPLSETDCGALAGAELPEDRRAAIFSESGGNPFYALQLARLATVSPGAAVPRSVAAALLEEFRTLSDGARALLDGGAIAGDPFEAGIAQDVACLDQAAGMEALDELLVTRLLYATDIPRRFSFRHPLVRRAVYDATGAGWRIGAHARAAAALERSGAPAVARAHHVDESAAPGDAAGIAVLLQAGAESAPRAPVGAARWYASALRLMPESDRAGRLAALVSLAQAQAATGDLEHSAARLIEALALLPEDDLAPRLRLTSACAACEHFLGYHDRAEHRLVAALRSLPDQVSRESVIVRLGLAAGAFFSFAQEEMCALAAEALDVARRLGEPVLQAASAGALAHAAALGGRLDSAQAAADEAAALLDVVPDSAVADHLDAVNRLAWAEFLIERHDASIRHAQRGVVVARAAGRNRFVPLILQAQALSSMVLGHLAAAAELQEEALEIATLAGNGYVTCSVLTTSGTVAMARGDHEDALRAGHRSVALIEHAEPGRIAGQASARLATTLRELGSAAADTQALVEPAGGWSLPRLPPTWRALWADPLTRADLAGGRIADAGAAAAMAGDTAAAFALPLTTALADRARARLAAQSGRHAEAFALAQDSAEAARRVGAPIEAARGLTVAAVAAAVGGDREVAVRLLRDAEGTFDDCGADRDRAEARRELRRLGARAEPRGPSGGSDAGLDALSRREREVATLVTDRKTNREIAGDLFLSEKTVESHLRNIFAKLGASSRVDVARAVERESLHP
jgi:DNA-binding NarL/FixJ family response regulator